MENEIILQPLNLADLKLASRAIFNIIIFGPIITMVVIAVCVHYILGINWGISFLTGSILVVSGPTVIAPLLARVRIAKNMMFCSYPKSVPA